MDKGKKGVQKDKNGEINDLIFKELIKRGYSLEGKTRVWNIADSKLWYLTPEQAQAYLDLEGSPEYKKEMIDAEMELIKESMPDISQRVLNKKKEIIIIDIGCGDGKKAIFPIQSLKSKAKIIYCPIDISGYMVEKSIENIKKTDIAEIVQFQWNISDFENLENVTRLLRIGGRELFMLFLG
ncbi:MAG TPA: L-histidine N(alpha)-methyltransferase, partial [Patescibacteria group bacterium]|nr:L-histidine N(alpha)-methyltransferase [Patescibacteria group bacterium]